MALARSKITAQGQISVPAAVRRKLGVGPGSVLEWEEDGGKVVVRRSGQYTFADIRKALFPDGPPRQLTVEEMDEAIAQEILERHARR
jgi:AbrB family looped-hinge helix DNA binding protein